MWKTALLWRSTADGSDRTVLNDQARQNVSTISDDLS